jgi:hypothetical protein
MYFRSFVLPAWLSFVLTVVVVSSLTLSSAQVMTSSNYQIQSDSVNVGGGNSSSTNYGLESTTGEIATGNSSSTNYALRAGYQQMQEVFLSLSTVADAVMSPSLGGITGGVANGTTSFVVVTDSPSGYSVSIAASTTPAMQSTAGTIANYTPAGAVPDFTFTTGSGQAHFGFTPEGPDIALRYQDSGGVCGVAGGDTSFACWDALGTTSRTIVSTTNNNQPNGATTTLRFRVGIGGTAGVTAGTYIATTTITALPL